MMRSLEEVLEVFQISDEDTAALSELSEHIVPVLPDLTSKFYTWLESLREFEEYFHDQSVLERVKSKQLAYWESFFEARFDEEYLAERINLGRVHARIALPIHLWIAGMDHWVALFTQLLTSLDLPPERSNAIRRALNKLVHFDLTLTINSYEQLVNERITAQSRTLLEMSTPVTKIWEGILLLPLVGIIDSKRAQDIMNTTLEKIKETSVRSFILDISGVAVVDTAVANHLIKITKATKMMGCETIISGISPEIAETIVELGIDVGDIKTTGNMRAAMEAAMDRMGLAIRDKYEGEEQAKNG